MRFSVNFLLNVVLLWMLMHGLTSCENNDKLFIQVNSSASGIQFENKPTERAGLTILDYLYYYNGGGVAVGDINNDGLPDIYFTANEKGGNKLYLNKGNFVFEDITEKAGVKGISDWCSGVTMADINGDSFLDIYVSTVSGLYGLSGHNELYINNGNTTFQEKSAAYGLDITCTTTQTAFFDYDHDGDLDCYVLNQSHHPHGNITDTSKRIIYDSLSGDRFYRNDITETGKFTDISAISGIYQSNLGYGLGIAVADFNNDGWDDIYIGNDFHENDYYYVNNGNGTFSEKGSEHFKHYSRFSMGNDASDFNNDGQIDIITVDMLPDREEIVKTYGSDENIDIYKVKLENNGYQNQYSKNALQRNNGGGNSFSEISLLSGVAATDWSWSPLFTDFDNDGNKDLFITSGIVKRPVDLDHMRFLSSQTAKGGLVGGVENPQQVIDAMPDGSSHPFFFKGDGNMLFTDRSDAWGTHQLKGYFNGAAYADFDNNGNMDIVVNCINNKALLLRNQSLQKRHIKFVFEGNGQNKNGIGAKIYVFSNGNMQFQQVMCTRGFQSSVEPKLHFGLGENKKVDSVLVVWPNQTFQWLREIESNGIVTVKEANAKGTFLYSDFFSPSQPAMEDITKKTGVVWSHKENSFNDFDKQYLIPHKLSAQGPKIAVADVNNDGLEDFYVCGAAEQPGVLMLQTQQETFIETGNDVFGVNSMAEEVAAAFFDANNDGAKDLYVVNGGNQYDDGTASLADRLYLNDGRGRFTDHSEKLLPIILKNKSCITAADFDKDGDTDVFVGGLADPLKYGVPQPSYLLINNGQGVFTLATQSIANLRGIGMVTCAVFSDVNNDGWDDLIVTGEWMPVKIFINQKGIFIGFDIAASTGLWQTMLATDVNGDGLQDILAGNFGYNTKFYAGKQGPLKLYVKDFDKNGSVEQIICYTIDGKEYTFLAKDELERSLPILKKAYLKYREVAGKTVQYMFHEQFKDYIEWRTEELASCVFINQGNGQFKKLPLPIELQVAPVFSFAEASKKKAYIVMGNLYGVLPYEGRYDALQPIKIEFDKAGTVTAIAAPYLPIDGEVRDSRWIKSGNKKEILVIVRNNQELLFFKPNPESDKLHADNSKVTHKN